MCIVYYHKDTVRSYFSTTAVPKVGGTQSDTRSLITDHMLMGHPLPLLCGLSFESKIIYLCGNLSTYPPCMYLFIRVPRRHHLSCRSRKLRGDKTPSIPLLTQSAFSLIHWIRVLGLLTISVKRLKSILRKKTKKNDKRFRVFRDFGLIFNLLVHCIISMSKYSKGWGDKSTSRSWNLLLPSV